MSTMPISIAEDEQVLRAYNIAEVDKRSIANTRTGVSKRRSKKNNTTGTMYVTNRRIIYNVDNVSSSVVHGVNNGVNSQQIRIEDVQGVDFMTSHSRPSLILPIILIALGLVLSVVLVGVVILIAGIISLIRRLHAAEDMMMVGIKSQASGYGIFISEMSREYYQGISYWCAPTKEFEVMSRELGAIILDLQKYGDECIGKWTQPTYSAPIEE